LPALHSLSLLHLRPQSRWRRRAPFSPEEIRRTERWLATARVFLAISALIAIWRDPSEVRSIWAYVLLVFYIGQGTAIIFLLRSRQQSTPAFRMLVHGADIIWPALVSLFTSSQSNPFFLFFIFVLAAAAYRWGLWETVMTSAASVAMLWLDSLAISLGGIWRINEWLTQHHLPIVRVDIADFQPRRLFMRSIYLIVMGLLLGYLAEQQKKLRAEKDVTARLLGLVRLDSGLATTLSNIAGGLLNLYGARRAIIASRDSADRRVSVAILELKKGIAEIQWIDPGAGGSETYLRDTAATSWWARSSRDTHDFRIVGLDSEGILLREVDSSSNL
jgi:hypothetical protein